MKKLIIIAIFVLVIFFSLFSYFYEQNYSNKLKTGLLTEISENLKANFSLADSKLTKKTNIKVGQISLAFDPWLNGFPYRRPIIINNTQNSNDLTDYQVLINLGIVGVWKFDEGSGTTTHDSSGNGLNGIIYGATWTTGKYGNALHFAGSSTNDRVDFGTPTLLSFDATKEYTWSAWIKLEELNRKQIIFAKYSSGVSGYHIFISADNKLSFQEAKNWAGVYGSTSLTTGTWYHIAVTYKNGQVKLYINGNLDKTGSITATSDTSNPFLVSTSYGPEVFHGIIDEPRFFNRALSDAEIKSLYRNFDDIRFADADGSLLSYWKEVDGKFWVKVPSIPASSTKTIYMYYGNPSATSQSNGDAVFMFFDDFDGSSIDSSKWPTIEHITGGEWQTESSAYYEVVNNTLHIHHESNDADNDCDTTGVDNNGWRFYSSSLSLLSDAKLRIEVVASFANVDWYRGWGDLAAVFLNESNQFWGSYMWYRGDYKAEVRRCIDGTCSNIADVAEYSSGNLSWQYTFNTSTYEIIMSGTYSDSASGSGTISPTANVVLSTFAGACWGDGIVYDVYYERIIVRKYTDSEPTTSIGAEEVLTTPTGSATGWEWKVPTQGEKVRSGSATDWEWVVFQEPLGSYRRPIIINNTQNSNDLTDYQVLVTVDTASLISVGKMRSDCGDIRFTDSDGITMLSYWLEAGCNTSSTRIWVKVPSIPASSTKTIYMYYGNPDATSESNGTAVFEFFDDFSTDPSTNGKWEVYRYSGDTSNEFVWDSSNGVVYLTKAVDGKGTMVFFNKQLSYPFIIEFKYLAGGGDGADGLAFAFDKDIAPYRTYGSSTAGGRLGLEAYDGSSAYISDGYAVEFDNYQNSGDPSANHVAVIRTNVDRPYNHIAYYNTSATEDNSWHSVKVIATSTAVTVILDGTTILNQIGISPLGYGYAGFGAGTGGLNNNHIIDDVRVRKYTSPEPTTNIGAEEWTHPSITVPKGSATNWEWIS